MDVAASRSGTGGPCSLAVWLREGDAGVEREKEEKRRKEMMVQLPAGGNMLAGGDGASCSPKAASPCAGLGKRRRERKGELERVRTRERERKKVTE